MAHSRLPALCAGLIVLALTTRATADTLPRFTEEREAAALHFVRKHVPDLVPLLNQLKETNSARYQQEVREIFRVTEMLAEMLDTPRRHELELKIWKAETKAATLVARLSTPGEADRKKLTVALKELAAELVDLEMKYLEVRAEVMEKELAALKEDLTRARGQAEKAALERYERLLNQVKKPKAD